MLFITYCIRYAPQLFNTIKRVTDIDVTTRFENIITSNQSNKYNLINKKPKNAKGEIDWVMDPWQYSSSTRLIDDSTLSNKLDMMFTEVFNIMDETKTQIAIIIQSHDLGITFQNTYYGNIKLYDIGDTNTMSEYGLINFRV